MAWKNPNNIERQFLRALYAFAAPQSVSTETPLLPLTQLGDDYIELFFTLRNHDLTNAVVLYVDRSESGTSTDEDRTTVTIGPGRERKFEFRDVASLYWALSAAGSPDAGFPSCLVSWQVVGRSRIR